MLRGKKSRVLKRVEDSVVVSSVEGKKWRDLNRLLDGMLVEHYAWGLVADQPEPARPRADRGREAAGVARKLENQLEKSNSPKRPGVYSLAQLGRKMRGGRQTPAKK